MVDRKEPDWSNLTREHALQIATLLREAYALGKSHGPDWLPIADAPRDGTTIIVPGGTAEWRRDYWFSHQAQRTIQWEVNHFMPLPPEPKP